mmetsp:Transcript_5840/g.23078  ORF Transcript_5840/g.23078 Transcript_5840/m.23078 type:complete len:106 (+) Transcript_5840:169-486(+)
MDAHKTCAAPRETFARLVDAHSAPRARDAWSSLAFVRERARLLDVHTHRGDFETHTQPKDVFDLFEENNGISVCDNLAVGSECEQSVYSLATQELVSQYFEYRQS